MKIVQSLLSKGADPGKSDKGGRTPVDEAQDAECVPAHFLGLLALAGHVVMPLFPADDWT
jgi:hypothetical protein